MKFEELFRKIWMIYVEEIWDGKDYYGFFHNNFSRVSLMSRINITRLTFTAGVVAVLCHFGRTNTAFDVQIVAIMQIATVFNRAGPWPWTRPLTTSGWARRPLRPAVPHTFTRLQVANSFHETRSIAIGSPVTTVTSASTLLSSTTALAWTRWPFRPVRPASIRISWILC